MEQRLQQKLIALGVVLALVVIFGPMLFRHHDSVSQQPAQVTVPIPPPSPTVTVEPPEGLTATTPHSVGAQQGLAVTNSASPVKPTLAVGTTVSIASAQSGSSFQRAQTAPQAPHLSVVDISPRLASQTDTHNQDALAKTAIVKHQVVGQQVAQQVTHATLARVTC